MKYTSLSLLSPLRPFVLLSAMLLATAGFALELGLPPQCTLGKDCFVQQYADMDAGPGVTDPFCGPDTYDGHDGTDLRVLSMADVARGVAVVAVADGTVLRSKLRIAIARVGSGNESLFENAGCLVRNTRLAHP